MSPVFLAGLGAPLVVLILAALAVVAFGMGWALVVLGVGMCVIVGIQLRHLDRLARWAEGHLDADVPEAGGAWGLAFSALYRRGRLRMLHQRGLATTVER